MRPWFLLIALLLAACTTLPSTPQGNREQIENFSLDGRFVLRATPPAQAAQSSSGRLHWTHIRSNERILLASPLGIGIAEIESSPGKARLQTADGRTWEATSPDELIEIVTGQALPISRISAWLLGRSGQPNGTELDEAGRPSQLREGGWQIDYSYDDTQASALPARINLNNGQGIELRLRIEEWRNLP